MVLPGKAELNSPADSGESVSVERGQVWVELNYAQDGKLQGCRIVRSNIPFDLEASTIDFIRKHWQCALFAGETVVMPIVYDEPATATFVNNGMVPPPDPFPSTDPEHDMRLRVSFGSDGWVKDVTVTEPTGDDLADKETAMWVKVHWHRQSYANQVLDVPFVFRPAPVPSPTTPASAPSEPASAETPVPAVRVE